MMVEFASLWFIGGVVFVIFRERADAFLLRCAKWLARQIGQLFGVDAIEACRWINRVATPVAVIGCAVAIYRDVDERGARGAALLFDVVLNAAFYLGRWLSWERNLIAETARERESESLRGALSFELRLKLRRDRLALYVATYIYLLFGISSYVSGSALERLHASALAILMPAGLTVALLLSIEQPPYQFVSIRERMSAMWRALTPQVAAKGIAGRTARSTC